MLPADLITPKQAAKILRCHISTVHRWIDHGQLRGYRKGTTRKLVSRADVEAKITEIVPLAQIATRTDEERRAAECMRRLAEKGIGSGPKQAPQE